jgi:Fe-S cluster assembly protein SufD
MNPDESILLQGHDAAAAALPGARHAAVAARRAGAADRFRRQGLPHAKVEAWKYTRLKDLEALPFVRAEGTRSARAPDTGLGALAARIVLVDGRFDATLSVLPAVAGLTVRPLRDCLEAGDAAVLGLLDRELDFAQAPLAALAGAWLEDGAVISVAPGVAVDLPVEVVSVASAADAPRIAFPRLAVSLEAGASLTLVESFYGPAAGAYAVDAATDIAVGEGASLNHYVLQAEGAGATHVSAARCDVAAKARYEGFVLQLGGHVARHEARLRMLGEGGEARLNGAYAAAGDSVCDTTTEVRHVAAGTFTDQVFKGILDDRARGVFQGRVQVHRDAQRIVGNQLHNALLLSRKAEVDCKPELLIFADDVKCSHGATCGELSEEELFYLRSRGIDGATARALLLEAFLGAAFDLIGCEAVKAVFAARAAAWLAARRAA